MGLFDFIFGRSRTTITVDNTQGYFSDEEVRIIDISDIASRLENPVGAFCCKTMHCPTHWIRYIPAAGESIADVMRCPKCGQWMIHAELDYIHSQLSQKIKYGSAGSRELYQDALRMLALDERVFTARSLAEPNDVSRKSLQVASFDVLLDLAPIVFDEATLNNLARCMDNLKLDRYPTTMIPTAFDRLRRLRELYQQLENSKTYKQVDLKKDFLVAYPEIRDPTWIFYVWSNFGFFKRTNIKNRVYLTKQSQHPQPN